MDRSLQTQITPDFNPTRPNVPAFDDRRCELHLGVLAPFPSLGKLKFLDLA